MKVLKCCGGSAAEQLVEDGMKNEVMAIVRLGIAEIDGVTKIIGWSNRLEEHPVGSCAIFMDRAGRCADDL